MKSNRYTAIRLNVIVMLLVSLAAASISGCCEDKLRIVPIPSRNVMALTADDIIQVMSRAGFSDEQIIEFGPGIRRGLLDSGAVQIRQGRLVQAVFAVQDDFVYVSTSVRGSFIYNVKSGSLHTGGREPNGKHPETLQPDAMSGDGSGQTSPTLKTSTTGNTGPKLQLFNG